MSVPVLTFFNNKGGVGKTSLVYHLSWMLSEMGYTVTAADVDAQSNLTAAFLGEDELEELWNASGPNTLYRALEPILETGDLLEPESRRVNQKLYLIPGDVSLALFEDSLSEAWLKCLGGEPPHRPFRIVTAFWQLMQMSAERTNTDILLVDVGPNLGAINRSALIASDCVAVPLGADLFSLQGLKNLGPTLRRWRDGWKKRLENWPKPRFALPSGRMTPLGYIVQQHGVRLSRPVIAYDKWINRMPGVYHRSVLEEDTPAMPPSDDPECLAMINRYRSLIPLAREAGKPIFHLAPADGAIGSHALAVRDAGADFRKLAEILMDKMRERTGRPGKPPESGE